MSPVTDLFFPVLLLNQRWSPPLTLQASHCNTFRIMCDVPSIAVFCSESIECFPGTVSIFFLKLLVTIPVAPVITGTIVHFRFHIRCISIHKLLYFNFFSASSLLLLLLLLLFTAIGLLPGGSGYVTCKQNKIINVVLSPLSYWDSAYEEEVIPVYGRDPNTRFTHPAQKKWARRINQDWESIYNLRPQTTLRHSISQPITFRQAMRETSWPAANSQV